MRLIILFYVFKILRLLISFRLDQDYFPKFLAVSKLLPNKYKDLHAAERFKLMLEHMGPLWVKFGQILSTRYDVFPEQWIDALSQLQDAVKPFPDSEALAILEAEIEDFSKEITLDPVVLASASIAQVYAGKLHDGTDIVLKVLRPGVRSAIKRDISCLKMLAKFLSFIIHDARRLHLLELVEELEHSLQQEVNFLAEAANASAFARNFTDDNRLQAPEAFWDYTTDKVLVLSRIFGTPIADIEALKADGVDLSQLAKLGIELFFTQVLRDSYFHADMHPGNIFVVGSGFRLVDFGIVGSLNAVDQRYIAENMLAFFRRDYRRVAVLHVESGWVPSDTRIEHFEAAIRQVCEPIFAKPLKDISFGQLFLQLLRTARAFKTEIQPQLLLLQKTLLQVEALGRMLDPELDLWATVQPQLEKWVDAQVGVQGLLAKSKENLPYWLERAPDMPELIFRYLNRPNSRSCTCKESGTLTMYGFLLTIVVMILAAICFVI